MVSDILLLYSFGMKFLFVTCLSQIKVVVVHLRSNDFDKVSVNWVNQYSYIYGLILFQIGSSTLHRVVQNLFVIKDKLLCEILICKVLVPQ